MLWIKRSSTVSVAGNSREAGTGVVGKVGSLLLGVVFGLNCSREAGKSGTGIKGTDVSSLHGVAGSSLRRGDCCDAGDDSRAAT